MSRFFNTTGVCDPERHYVVDPLRGIYSRILELIRQQAYFLLHAPRQTGKTTLLHELARRLNRDGKYIATVFSVENARHHSISVEEANQSHIRTLHTLSKFFLPEAEMPPSPGSVEKSESGLFNYLEKWASAQAKPIVLLLDEADSLHDSCW